MTEERLRLGAELEFARKAKTRPPSTAPKAARPRFIPRYKDVQMNRQAVEEPQRFTYAFTDAGRDLCLTGEGLNQLYLCFGAPGVGKSYFLARLLEQLAAPGWPASWGGLLLDPKQTLIRDVKNVIPADRLHVIAPGTVPHTNI